MAATDRAPSPHLPPVAASDDECATALCTDDASAANCPFRRAYELERGKSRRAREARRAFLATISHEIRTPLNGIMTVAQLMLAATGDDNDAGGTLSAASLERYVRTILRCGVQLLTCVNDILDYSKLKSDALRIERAPFALLEFVSSLRDQFAPQCTVKGVTLRCEMDACSGDATTVVGDAKRLQQVVGNLFSNALRFSPTGASISIHFRLERRRQGKDDDDDDDDDALQLCATVADEGRGVQPEEAERIFHPFAQSNMASAGASPGDVQLGGVGAGLGLAIARRLARAMGGDLWLDTHGQRKAGASFSLRVPVAAADDVEVLLRAHCETLATRRVLIVDDMLENRLHLASLATRAGMAPHTCASGEEALLVLRAATPTPIDIAWVDVHMGASMGGVELAREVRTHEGLRALPLISLSSVGDDYGGESLFCARMEKPVDDAALLRNTALALEHRATATPTAPVADAERLTDRVRPLRVLVADDDATSRQVMFDVLHTCPASLVGAVKIVEDGAQVLRQMDLLAASRSQQYDVALLDIVMPAMDGLQCARAIRARPLGDMPRPTVIVLTANATDEMRARCAAQESGVDLFLTKPLDVAALVATLERLQADLRRAGQRARRDGASARALSE